MKFNLATSYSAVNLYDTARRGVCIVYKTHVGWNNYTTGLLLNFMIYLLQSKLLYTTVNKIWRT